MKKNLIRLKGANMEAKNIIEVEEFILECNDMLTGRFLDLNKRLEKFLTCMTKSEDIVDFLAECLTDFDDEVEFAKAFSVDRKSGTVRVSIPTDDKSKIALITTIFNNLTSNKLNINQFLETYFNNNKLAPTQNFLSEIIRPFRDLICKYFRINTNITLEDIRKMMTSEKLQYAEQEGVKQEEQLPHLSDLIAEIKKNCNQILSLLQFEKKRNENYDDVEFIVSSIIDACQKEDLRSINGMIVGLVYASKKLKNIRYLVEDMKDLIYNYYDYLEEIAENVQN